MSNFESRIAGTGYIVLPMAVLSCQHNNITVVNRVLGKVDLVNQHKLPVQNEWAKCGIRNTALSP